MAKKIVFQTSDKHPFFVEENVEFQYYNGFSITQKQKTIQSLHAAYSSHCPNSKILEISSKSENALGVKLSAFNLLLPLKSSKEHSVEVVFQSSKVFKNGGPYLDILSKTSSEAKRDSRLKNSGELQYFYFKNHKFELIPKTYFYDWLYINTLNFYPDLTDELMQYDAFTDIEFNPFKSINCQARSAAIYVSLRKNNLLEKALETKDSFLNIVYNYNCSKLENTTKQLSFLNSK